MDQDTKFLAAYNELNDEQQHAVDEIYGPVMVVAGPGTGKTQILALRICNILQKTDTQPHNILCLTFTDQGALEMKHRLIQFMGADAYKVHIHTYHSFARKVISENPDHFQNSRLEPLSDLEAIEIIKGILDKTKPGDLLFNINEFSRYDNLKPLRTLYSNLKQENLDQDTLKIRIKEHCDWAIKHVKGLGYAKGENKGKPTAKGKTFLNGYKKTIEALDTYQPYLDALDQRNRFDFQDMINWTIEAMTSNDDLRLDYQEQFHFVLADEFQDSSGSQMEIIRLLTKEVEQANIFVVGDDDQSIYRFQGANLTNLVEFKRHYDPTIVVLLKNYRSSKQIVEASKNLIDVNDERLNKKENFSKEFVASGIHKDAETQPQLLEFENIIAEEAYIYHYIKQAYEAGKDLKEIGVIYKKHTVANDLIRVLTKENIPVKVKRKVDIIKVPYIRNLLNVLDIISKLNKHDHRVDHLVPDLLNLPSFNVSFTEVYKLSSYIKNINRERSQKNKESKENTPPITWTDILFDEEQRLKAVGEESHITKASHTLQEWVQAVPTKTVQVIFQKVIEEGGFLHDALTANDNYWKLELLNTLFDFIKDSSSKDPDFSLERLMQEIRLMEENSIPLNYLDIISDSNGVQFVSCHGSKGMQFETVFMLGTSQKNWKPFNNTKAIKIPPAKDPESIDDDGKKAMDAMKEDKERQDLEESRRLYYVSMTRAKKNLYITYGVTDTETGGKASAAANISQDLMDQTDYKMEKTDVSDDIITDYQVKRMTEPKIQHNHWMDESLLNDRLEDYVMNITHVNKYVKCPITYYFETILHVPSARTDSMGYGNAVHQALENHIKLQHQSGSVEVGVDNLIKEYNIALKKFSSHFNQKEILHRIEHGEKMLRKYYESYHREWYQPKKMEFEKTVENVVINGVPMKGNIDRVDTYEDKLVVFDYKTGSKQTGKVNPPNEEKNYPGDQWRQIVAYNLLIDASTDYNLPMKSGILDFTESKDDTKLKRALIDPSLEDKERVAMEIKEVYNNIKAHNFEPGCGEEKCRWCQFVQAEYGKVN